MRTLHSIPPEYLSDLLIPPEKPVEKIVWPLSLLALRQVLQRLCISRDPIASGAETKVSETRITAFYFDKMTKIP